MLPKPEKSKKLTNLLAEDKASTESEAEISQKRLLLKRRLILISLLMTAGISFIFWSFRAAQKIIHQPPQFNLSFKFPRPNFSLKNNPSTNQTDIFVLSDSNIFLISSADFTALSAETVVTTSVFASIKALAFVTDLQEVTASTLTALNARLF